MELNSTNKLEAYRQLPHLQANRDKGVSVSESPPDVSRLVVPPEELDRVDGIRPSSSRTRAVALLPAIEESAEEGPGSPQVVESVSGKLSGRRPSSSRPVLSSISEEGLPRHRESINTRSKSPGYELGAGEAPSQQQNRSQEIDQSQLQIPPNASGKAHDGEPGLVEGGDADLFDGNRSNHALGEPDQHETDGGATQSDDCTVSGAKVELSACASKDNAAVSVGLTTACGLTSETQCNTEQNSQNEDKTSTGGNDERGITDIVKGEAEAGGSAKQASNIDLSTEQTLKESLEHDETLSESLEVENKQQVGFNDLQNVSKENAFVNQLSAEESENKNKNLIESSIYCEATGESLGARCLQLPEPLNSSEINVCRETVRDNSNQDLASNNYDQACEEVEGEGVGTSIHVSGPRPPNFAHNENGDELSREPIFSEVTHNEDCLTNTACSTRAKGSGSDSAVAEGTYSSVDIAGVRESHSDHTSCSDKIEHATKVKEGVTKTRGRDRERGKRAKRTDREERKEKKSLKNAVGDAHQGVEEHLSENATEDAELTLAQKTQNHETLSTDFETTIRAASSGDVRNDAVKSTCGLESQTVTSIEESPSDCTDMSSAREEDRIWDEFDNGSRPHTPPKVLLSSRFGKRTQHNRQRQSSSQGNSPSYPNECNKSDVQPNNLGLGDSKYSTSSCTTGNSAIEVSVGQNESGNNPGGAESNSLLRDPNNNELTPSVISHENIETEEEMANGHNGSTEENLQSSAEENLTEDSECDTISVSDAPAHFKDIESKSEEVETVDNQVNWRISSVQQIDNSHQEGAEIVSTNQEVGDVLEDCEIKTAQQAHDMDASNAKQSLENEYPVNSYTHQDTDKDQCEANICESSFVCPEHEITLSPLGENGSSCTGEDGGFCCGKKTEDGRISAWTASTGGRTDSMSDASGSSGSDNESVGSGERRGSGKRRSSNFDKFRESICLGGICLAPKIDLSQYPSAAPFPDGQDNQGVNNGGVKNQEQIEVQTLSESHDTGVKVEINKDGKNSTVEILMQETSADELESSKTDIKKNLAEALLEISEHNTTIKESLKPPSGQNRNYDVEKEDNVEIPTERSYQSEKWEEAIFIEPKEGLHVPHSELSGVDLENALVSALEEAAQDSWQPELLDHVSHVRTQVEYSQVNVVDKTVCSNCTQEDGNSVPRVSEDFKEDCLKNDCRLEDFTCVDGDIPADIPVTRVEGDVPAGIPVTSIDDDIPTNIPVTSCESNKKEVESCNVNQEVSSVIIDNEHIEESKSEKCVVKQAIDDVGDYESKTVEVEGDISEFENVIHDFDKCVQNNVGDGMIHVDENIETFLCIQADESATGGRYLRDLEMRTTMDESKIEVGKTADVSECANEISEDIGTPAAKYDKDNTRKRAKWKMDSKDPNSLYRQVESEILEYLSEDASSGNRKPSVTNCDEIKMNEPTESDDKRVRLNEEMGELESKTNKIFCEVQVTEMIPSENARNRCTNDELYENGSVEEPGSLDAEKCLNGDSEAPQDTHFKDYITNECYKKLETETEQNTHAQHLTQNNKVQTGGEYMVSDLDDDDEEESHWADHVIDEIDKVCDQDLLRSANQSRAPELNTQDTFIGVEEIGKVINSSSGTIDPGTATLQINKPVYSPSFKPSSPFKVQGQREVYSVAYDSDDDRVRIPGRSKDGGLRAKRSKSSMEDEHVKNTSIQGSDCSIRKIRLVDVEKFPTDAPCVYHPERHFQPVVPDQGDPNANKKKSTLWKRFKTLLRRTRPSRRYRSLKMENAYKEKAQPSGEVAGITSLPAPILNLRRQSSSDNTLDLSSGAQKNDPLSGSHHKAKIRSPGQWRRLKKFRVLRLGAERRLQGSRLPATKHQVVSKNNFVREAEKNEVKHTTKTGNHGNPRRRQRSSAADIHLLETSSREQLGLATATRSTPEVSQVFAQDEKIADRRVILEETTVRMLLKPAPADRDKSKNIHDGMKRSLLESVKSATFNGKSNEKQPIYKGKSSTYQKSKMENAALVDSPTRANKNCLLM